MCVSCAAFRLRCVCVACAAFRARLPPRLGRGPPDLSRLGWDERARRQLELSRKYKFECVCAACCLTGAPLAASEARRRRIATLREALVEDDDVGRPPPAVLADAAELCELADAEGLPAVWQSDVIIRAMRAAKEAGRAAEAIRWAERGARDSRLALGAKASATLKFDAVLRAWRRAVAAGDPLPG